MIASRGRADWIARQAMRGLIQSGLAARARAFQVVPGSSSSWSMRGELLGPGATWPARCGRGGRGRARARAGGASSPSATRPASPTMPDGDRLGQADARGVHVHLDDLGALGPVVDAVAGQRREGVEAGAEREDHVGLADQLHGGLGAVVAEGAREEGVRAGEGVVVLVAHADRRGEPLGQAGGGGDRAGEDHARAVQDHGALGARPGGAAASSRAWAPPEGRSKSRAGGGPRRSRASRSRGGC